MQAFKTCPLVFFLQEGHQELAAALHRRLAQTDTTVAVNYLFTYPESTPESEMNSLTTSIVDTAQNNVAFFGSDFVAEFGGEITGLSGENITEKVAAGEISVTGEGLTVLTPPPPPSHTHTHSHRPLARH